MKLSKFMLVSLILLAIISLGAVSAASDTADDAVDVANEDLSISSSDVSEITVDSDDLAADSEDSAIGSDANDISKLGASAEDKLSAGTVAPNYTIEVSPNKTDAGNNYIAQYGQVITVNGTIENAAGNVSIRFGYSGNYHYFNVTLEDGKFSQDITCYDRVRNNYNIQVTWPGDDTYKSISWSKNIHVQMEYVNASGAYYGLNPYIDVNLFDATGNVTFTLNNNTYVAELVDGKVIMDFTNYTIGKNTLDMNYSGDARFNSIEKSFTFNVDANVDAPTIYNYQDAIINVYMGAAIGKVNVSLVNATDIIESYDLDIVNGKVTTQIQNYAVGNNTLNLTYSGDDTFNPFETSVIFTVLPKQDAQIISSVYQTEKQSFILITIPYANGTINVTVNGKEEEMELVNETVKWDINASDEINELIVKYEGNVMLNPTTSSFFVNITDYIVNNRTFFNYFNQKEGGVLYDFIEDGVTLDFQGNVIINTDSANEMNIVINKPINIISSTKDAYIDLNCTAGSLLGEHPGSSFVVNRGGSGSNISGIYLHNTELWISNTSNVVFDNISVVVEDQRVGSGVGATSVRDNSSYVTLKNSYFYTRNNGGSTTFTFSWADHCIFDHNIVKAEGNVGNLLYLNVYNINNLPEPVVNNWGSIVPAYPLNNHNVFSNNELFGKEGSGISVGIMVEGEYNVIANNTLHKCSISTSFGGTGANNNTYYGNILENGSSMTAQSYSIVYDNIVPASISTGTGSVAYNNTAGTTMTVGANSVAYNNTVGTTMTVQAGSEAYDNTVTTLTISAANGTAHDNIILGNANLNGVNDTLYGNVIGGNLTLKGNGAVAYDNIIGDTTTGMITGASAGAEVYNNTVREISLTGKEVIVHDNIIITNNLAGDSFTLSGDNCVVYGNDVQGNMLLTGNNDLVYDNILHNWLTIGEEDSTVSATVYDNVLYNIMWIYGNGSVIYNNHIDDPQEQGIYLYGENVEIYDNDIVNGGIYIYSNNNDIHDNYVNSRVFVYNAEEGVNIYNNVINSMAWGTYNTGMIQNAHNVNIFNNVYNCGIRVMGSSNITFENNTITNTNMDQPALNFMMTTDSKAVANRLYSTIGNGDDAINNGDESNIVIGNYPIKPVVVVSANNVTVGQMIVVTVTIVEGDFPEESIMKVIANGELYEAYAFESEGEAYILGLPAGEYAITAITDAYGNYDVGMNSTTVKVSKFNPALELTTTEAAVGENVNITASIAGATGEVTFIIDGTETSVELTDGVATYTMQYVGLGTHSIVAIYNGDEKTEAVNNYTSFTIDKITPVLTVEGCEVEWGELATVKVNLTDIDGMPIYDYVVVTVDWQVDGMDVLLDLAYGNEANFDISSLVAPGTYNVTVRYLGSDYFTAVTNTDAKVVLTPSTKSEIDMVADEAEYGESLNLTITLVDGAGAAIGNVTVNLTVDGNEYGEVLLDEDGIATVGIIDLNAGEHTVVASFADETHDAATKELNVTVDRASGAIVNVTVADITVGKNATAVVTAKDAEDKPLTGIISIEIDSEIYALGIELDENGSASVPLTNLEAGKHSIEVIFSNPNYLESSFINHFAVEKKSTVLKVKNMTTFAYQSSVDGDIGDYLTATLVDSDGKPLVNKTVQVGLNGRIYTRTTNATGGISILMKTAISGRYTFAVSFLGDDNYNASFACALCTVNKQTPKLTTSSKTYKASASSKKLTATFKTKAGNPLSGKTIKFTVNGKTYSAKTNSKGVATVTVTLSTKGTYKFMVKYAGDDTYATVNKTATLKIK